MNAIEILRRLHQHRLWVNKKLIACSQPLSNDQLHQKFDIGQGTAWRSLCHMVAAEYVWLGTLQGDSQCRMPGDLPGKLPGNQEGEDALRSIHELIETWQKLSHQWEKYLAELTEESLETPVRRTSTSSFVNQTLETKCSDVLLHVCTHAHYTTAQVVNMFRQLGLAPLPDSMLITMARLEALAI